MVKLIEISRFSLSYTLSYHISLGLRWLIELVAKLRLLLRPEEVNASFEETRVPLIIEVHSP